MVEENRLHGLIMSRYGSIANFANQCGFSYSKAWRLVKGRQPKTEQDMRDLITALGIQESQEIVALFSLA